MFGRQRQRLVRAEAFVAPGRRSTCYGGNDGGSRALSTISGRSNYPVKTTCMYDIRAVLMHAADLYLFAATVPYI